MKKSNKIDTEVSSKNQLDLEKEKNRIILRFNQFVQENKSSSFWKDISQISNFSGSTAMVVTKVVQSFDEFCENSKGEYTTRELYEKHTNSFKKFLDSYGGIIK